MLGGGHGDAAADVIGATERGSGGAGRGRTRRYRLGAALLLVAACLPLLPRVLAFFEGRRRFELGWDLQVVCTSLDALRAGLDPYRHSRPFPLPYSVLHVHLFAPLCALGSEPLLYGGVFVLIAAASAVLLWRIVPATATDRLMVLAAVFLGLYGFPWQFATGNVAVVELPLASATVCLLAARRYRWAGAVFGAMASVKMLPLVGVVGFLALPEARRRRLEAVAAAIGGFLGIHLLNAVLFARWLPSYALQLVGRVPGGEHYESGGLYNQNVVDLVSDVLRPFGLGLSTTVVVVAVLALGLGWLVFTGRADARGQHAVDPAARVSIVVLVVWLFLFRQKPYAFATFVPFLVAAGYGAGREVAAVTILTSIVVPAALRNGIWQVPIIGAYYQLIGAWAAEVVLVFGRRWMASRTKAS